ncbi:thermonuclease family protein [Candidatus Microgenomates bacterium]|nr:thermonuclease family protein [Candidatus Microgenomates bacterium]
MQSNTKLLILASCLIIISGISLLWFGLKPTPRLVSSPASTPPVVEVPIDATASWVVGVLGERFLVTEVVDGDTVKLETGQTVRLIGIDTPETKDPRKPVQCFGKEASSETKNLLEGERVILQKDVSEIDSYKRLLRYVFLPLDDGQLLFINDYLVREGFARVLTYPPDVKYNEQLREAERQAKEEKRGLWGRC